MGNTGRGSILKSASYVMYAGLFHQAGVMKSWILEGLRYPRRDRLSTLTNAQPPTPEIGRLRNMFIYSGVRRWPNAATSGPLYATEAI